MRITLKQDTEGAKAIENTLQFEATPGSEMKDCIKEAYQMAVDFECEVQLTFNWKTHTITRFTNLEKIENYWF